MEVSKTPCEFWHQSFSVLLGSRGQHLVLPQLSTPSEQAGTWGSTASHPYLQQPSAPLSVTVSLTLSESQEETSCQKLNCIQNIRARELRKLGFLPSMFSSSDKEKNIGRGWKWIPYLEQIIFIFSAFYLESVISLNALVICFLLCIMLLFLQVI